MSDIAFAKGKVFLVSWWVIQNDGSTMSFSMMEAARDYAKEHELPAIRVLHCRENTYYWGYLQWAALFGPFISSQQAIKAAKVEIRYPPDRRAAHQTEEVKEC